MKTDKITIAGLFEMQRRYIVPIFQRGYVWTRPEQWEPLWEDIRYQAEQVRTAGSSTHGVLRNHFLGAVVISHVNVGLKHVPASEVIDGQQRLTTLQVLLAAFRDVTAPLGNAFLTASLKRLTENQGPLATSHEQLKVWPTNAFREELQAVLTAGSPAVLDQQYPVQKFRGKPQPRPPLVEAYDFFSEAICLYLKGQGEDDDPPPAETALSNEHAEALLAALTQHVQLVEIRLDPEDDPQVIFETLNARGAPLKPSDLIRNFVFLYATRRGENVDALYEAYWRDFDETPDDGRSNRSKRWWRFEQRQGRLRTTRLDLFLYHYLTCQTERDLKITHVFPEFRDWWNGGATSGQRDTAEQLSHLKGSARVFRSLIEPDRRTPLGRFADRLGALDTTTVYPLTLHLADWREQLPRDEFEGMLVDIESYLVRRATCGLTPKNYNRTFLSLLRALRAKGGPPRRPELQRLLLAMEGDSSLWPDDDLFHQHWIHAPLYHLLGPGRTRMVLGALDEGQRTSHQEDILLDGQLSVEHVWPQGGYPPNWPEPARLLDGRPDWEAERRLQRLIQSIGNLTLLTQPLNSAVSNGPFGEKRRAIAGQSLLHLNAYFQRFGDADEWSEATIHARAEELFGVARRVWPRPAIAS